MILWAAAEFSRNFTPRQLVLTVLIGNIRLYFLCNVALESSLTRTVLCILLLRTGSRAGVANPRLFAWCHAALALLFIYVFLMFVYYP